MAGELVYREKWSQSVHELVIGAGVTDGGTRTPVIKVGGQSTLPFLFSEGDLPHAPVIAGEVSDVGQSGDEWPEGLARDLNGCADDPAAWSEMLISQAGADMVCLKFEGLHPDFGDKSGKDAANLLAKILKKIKVPMIVLGCGDHKKDNEALVICSESASGERLLFGDALQENYKTLTAACIADGHGIIAESPIDVNIAKQLNILISDLGMPLDRIAINPTIGPLGYGLEYAYSIMERARLAALTGDKMLAMPFVCFIGQETWRVKEARAGRTEFPGWGDPRQRGIMWEVMTAMSVIQAGADIVTMRHPEAIKIVKKAIQDLMKNSEMTEDGKSG